MATELEWKLRLEDEAQLLRIWEDPALGALACAPPRLLEMRSTYYDTADRLLGRARVSLRRRLENGQSIVCCKAPLAGQPDGKLRREYECAAAEPAEALQTLLALGAPELVARAAEQGIAPVCGAEFTRRAVLLAPRAGCTCELALDYGRLCGVQTQIPLCELELELKSGPAEPVQQLAMELMLRFGLETEPRSKFARARVLA